MTDVGLLVFLMIGGIVGADAIRALLRPGKDDYDKIFDALSITDREKNKKVKYLGMTQNNNYILLSFAMSSSITSESFQKNKNAVQEKLGVDNLEIFSKKGYMYFKIRKPKPPAIRYQFEKTYPSHLVPIGYDEDFNLILWDLNIDAHLVVGGATASGKTVALHGMLNYMIRTNDYEIYLSDMKRGVDFNIYGFNSFDQIVAYANNVHQTQKLIALFGRESNKRWNEMVKVGAGNYQEWLEKAPYSAPKRAVLVIDEYPDLVPSRKSKDEVDYIEALVDLARKCRAVGMHIVISAQYPDAKTMPTNLKSNFTAKLGFRTSNAICSKVIIGHAGCEKLKVGQCMALFAGQELFIRTALVTKSDIRSLIDEHAYPSNDNIIDTEILDKESFNHNVKLLESGIDIDDLFTDEFMEGLG